MRHLLFALFFMLGSASFGQDPLEREVTINFKNIPLDKCLIQLEKQSGIRFSYNSKQINGYTDKINQKFENKPVRIILDRLLQGTQLQYKEIGAQITIYALKTTTESFVISGYIRAKKSGEELVGARIFFPAYNIGCITNSYGYYALEVPKGETVFTVSSLGMSKLTNAITVEEEIVLNLDLVEDTVHLNAVVIHRDSIRKDLIQSDLSQIDQTIISPLAISRVPPASGERDLLRYLQQLPGVQPSNDGGANFQVRGSGTGSNLVLIDEIPIYHPTHLLGIYSIINTDALKSAHFYKDYIPLQYGTRSASVLQILTKEGDLNKHHISGGISGYMGRLNLEGPIVKKQASFYFSGRFSTFPGALLNILGNQQLGNPSFYDLNGKINVKINSNNRIYFTGYFGRDALTDTISAYKWGNLAGAFRWNHIINTKTFSNFTLTHSEFDYRFSRYNGQLNGNYGQKVVTDKINYDVTNYHSNDLKFNYGFSVAFLRTSKGNFGNNSANLFLNRQAMENGFYASVEKTFSRKLSIKGGIRVPFSFHIGTGDTTSYLNADLGLTQVIYQNNKFYDPVFFADPRIVGTYRLNENNEFQFAAMVTSQNTHIINYVNYFLPIEIWTPSTNYLRPERNYQVSAGWTNHYKNMETSAIIYAKKVTNVLDYASPIFTTSTDIESNLLGGTLNVYGFELMINYRFTSWYSTSISYAYTHTKQQINGINTNQPYVAPNDRPHYFSLSQFFNLSKKWQITTNWIVHSGTAVTLPNGQFLIDGTAFPLYPSTRNAQRLPTFRRVDLSFRRQLGVKKRKDNWDLSFTITNFFGRFNPSVAYIDLNGADPGKLIVNGVDYSPFMISLNLNFHF